MWKFKIFFFTQILRESNCYIRNSITAYNDHFDGFWFHCVEKYYKTRSCSNFPWNQVFSNFSSVKMLIWRKNDDLSVKMVMFLTTFSHWIFYTQSWYNFVWFHVNFSNFHTVTELFLKWHEKNLNNVSHYLTFYGLEAIK